LGYAALTQLRGRAGAQRKSWSEVMGLAYQLTEEHRRKLQILRDQLYLMSSISFAATLEEDD
jgi:hypothetical protein